MLENIKLLSGSLGRMEYSSARQKLISNNIAHADTPKYTGKDLKPFALEDDDFVLKSPHTGGFSKTEQANASVYPLETRDGDVYDQTLNKNKVSIEEEMVKAADAESSHALARNIWQKSLVLLRMSMGGR
jgi:flagellar basal-body rod protein FlgB